MSTPYDVLEGVGYNYYTSPSDYIIASIIAVNYQYTQTQARAYFKPSSSSMFDSIYFVIYLGVTMTIPTVHVRKHFSPVTIVIQKRFRPVWYHTGTGQVYTTTSAGQVPH